MTTSTIKKNIFIDLFFFILTIILPVIFYTIISWYFISKHNPYDSYIDAILMFFKIFWFGGIILVPTSFIAFFAYGSPLLTDKRNLKSFYLEGWNPQHILNVVYVSKGNNIDSLIRSVQTSLILLKESGVKYNMEITTDLDIKDHFPLDLQHNNSIKFIVVPNSYTTEKLALYKARALQFSAKQRDLPFEDKDIYNLHLDEESQLTLEAISGIHKFLKNPLNRLSVGQGEIKYNAHNYGKNMFITAIDSIRTGDDLGRFRFQLKMLHKPLFGLHGSFLFIPELIEKQIGFDLGGRGSITEDAYFALIASSKGVRFNWIDGYIREQSPFSIKDILKQRKRWISGLEMLADDPILPLITRLPLRINLILWEITWISVLVTLINVSVGGSYYPDWLSYLAGLLTGGYISLYTLGAYRNLMDLDFGFLKKLFFVIVIFLLVPFAAIIEATAVIYALVNPMKSFEVVKK
jgi:hypothetical protein